MSTLSNKERLAGLQLIGDFINAQLKPQHATTRGMCINYEDTPHGITPILTIARCNMSEVA